MEPIDTPKLEPFNFIRIPVKNSISYLLSNISTTEEYIATVRNCDIPKIITFPLKDKLNSKIINYLI